MSEDIGWLPPRTADEVRRRNADLDAQLLALLSRAGPDVGHVVPRPGEWTLAENLGHLAEFPRFFAADLRRQLEREGVAVGRTEEHPDRLRAIAAARERDVDDLKADVRAAFAELSDVLAVLSDADLDRVGVNRKHGQEPLGTFLQRYVLHHKQEHVTQLSKLLDELGC